MLPPQAVGLSREEAMRLLAQLQETDQRLRDLREGLTPPPFWHWLARMMAISPKRKS
jgi:hypothetical protein